ncbi:hypothetical protein [Pseudaestuariivita sp.]|uniref:hypothetical protein n=1 Tax=Pseudaestuariivita sp. TaxID=2211669 RepID=UPI0040584636
MTRFLVCLAAFWSLLAGPALAEPNPVAATINAAIASGCGAAPGHFMDGVYNTDLDGDGRADLIIDHSGLRCAGAAPYSALCGRSVCRTTLFLRRDAELVPRMVQYGVVLDVPGTPRARITLERASGYPSYVEWNGRGLEAFEMP